MRELAGFADYGSFAAAHRAWVDAALQDIGAQRDRRWTESIAVGSSSFVERIKSAMGAMATGRSVRKNGRAYELREEQSAYSSTFSPENYDIAPK